MDFQNHVIRWLLEDNNPPVQYLTLKHLLDKPEGNPDVVTSKARLMEYPATREILAHSDEFRADEHAYRKYTGKYWQVIFLGQFLADGKDPRIADVIQALLKHREWVSKSGGQCLTANLLTAFRRLGYENHPSVTEETENLAQRIVDDKGIVCSALDYSLLSHCYMALPKLLLCFIEVPPDKRSAAVKKAIDLIIKTIIENEVYIYVPGARKDWQEVLARQPKREELPKGQTVKEWIAQQRSAFLAARGSGTRAPKQGWLKFGFPLHYNSDILETLYTLARAGTSPAPGLQKALQIVREKMTGTGVWILESTLNGKMFVNVEEKGQPGKWITYFALYVLKYFDENI